MNPFESRWGWIKQHTPVTCNLVTCLECHTSDGKTLSAVAICLWISVVAVYVLQFIFPFSLTRFKTSFPYQELSSWMPKTPHQFCKSSLWFIITRSLLQNLFMVNTQSPNFGNTFLSLKVSPLQCLPQNLLPPSFLLSASPHWRTSMPGGVPKRLGWVPWLLPHVCGSGTHPKPREDKQIGHVEEGGLCVLPHFHQSGNWQSSASCASLKTNAPELQPLGN